MYLSWSLFSCPSLSIPGLRVFGVVGTLLVCPLMVDSTDMGVAKIAQEVCYEEPQVNLNIFRCSFTDSRATSP